ncbi:flagellar hook-associated protein FlgL [Reinekea thalattae]|uniref:Flagellar hook-associated protein 3 n=1 Tax=Reinekea thalattae TaxID=2593301 RepID=A0A5C8Z7G9_9GAMM|nr:flagellar hook-associated protein FlgL [Reinekea thalattae]TXR53243.1 flagellar hook-associated protein 3 [Reinekea thalattae]
MADRISTSWSYSQPISDMLSLQVQVNETYSKISSGKEVQTASDDPVAMARILQLDQDINQMEQYQENIDMLEARLEIEDAALSGVADVLQGIRELVVQAGNEGVYEDTELQAIADEIQQYLYSLVDLANSKDGGGEYLFSGFQGDDMAFVESPGGGYSYQGDDGVREIKISDSVTLDASDAGSEVFLDIDSASTSFYSFASDQNTGSGIITQGITVDQEALDEFYPDDFYIEFNNEYELDPPNTNYTVYRVSDGRIMEGLENVEYYEGQDIVVGGMSVEITGDPYAGDQFIVESSQTQSMFVSIEKIIYAIENYSDNTELYAAAIADGLDNMDYIIDNVSTVRASIGSRLNTADNVDNQMADNILASQEIRSDLEDLDYAEAVSNLQYQEFVLQAVQQTYSTISQLSLFDYI